MSTSPPIDFDGLVDKFVRLRDKIKEIKDKHAAELAPLHEIKEKLEGILLDHLNNVGAENVSTLHGTVHKCRKDSASISDMAMFWNWVVINGEFDMVDRKANVPAVREYIEKQQELAKANPSVTPSPPPGVNFTTRIEVGVRRAGKK